MSSSSSLATHVHLELWGVDEALLNDPTRLEGVLLASAKAAGCTVLGSVKHRFEPQGASVVVLVAESHLAGQLDEAAMRRSSIIWVMSLV